MKYFFLVLIFITTVSMSQNIHRVMGTNNFDEVTGALQTYNGEYMLTGSTGGGVNGSSDILIMRLNPALFELWSTVVGTPQQDVAKGFIIAKDTGLVFSGYSNVNGNGYDVLLLKTDSMGSQLWYKTYGGSDWDLGYKLNQDNTGGYLIAAETYSYGNGNSDGYVIRTNEQGDTLWTRTFGGTGIDAARDILQARNGNIYVTGNIETSSGKQDFVLLKYDLSGNLMWQQTYGDSLDEIANSLFEMPDSSIAMVGTSLSNPAYDSQMYVVVADKNGNLIKKMDLGSTEYEEGNDGCLYNGNIALVGATKYGGQKKEVFMMVVDINGNAILPNNPTFGGLEDESGISMSITSSNQFLIAGNTESWYPGLQNFYIIKTDGAGFSGQTPNDYLKVNDLSESKDNSKLYPNPFSTATVFETPESITHFTITNLQGAVINDHFAIESSSPGNYIIKAKDALANGVYVLTVYSDKMVINKRLVLCR